MTRFISYAQNFEDVMLLRALKDVSNGFYIDVGAHHPVIDSVSKAFHDIGWHGIHVEPTPEHANLLRSQRPDDVVIQAAVSDTRDTIAFFEMYGLSTGNPAIAEMHRARGIESARIVVPCLTLDDVITQAGEREIHWLKIDVEGMEHQVIRGWHSSHLPWIVVVESTVPNSTEENWEQWEPLLVAKGYQFAYFDGLNRFYVSPEHLSLLAAFRASPNVFDDFTLHGDSSAPFCAYLNDKHRNTEQELQHNVETLISDISSLQTEIAHQMQLREDVTRQSEDRARILDAQFVELVSDVQREKQVLSENFSRTERELRTELAALRSEESRVAQESIEFERSMTAQLASAKEENHQDKHVFLRELLAAEQAHREVLTKLQQERDEREQALVARLVDTKEEISREKDALHRQLLIQKQAHLDSREQAHRELIDKIALMTAAHSARERELENQMRLTAAEHERLSLHWVERESALRAELGAREKAHIDSREQAHHELVERTALIEAAHAAREQDLHNQIRLTARENERLSLQWVERERVMIADLAAREQAHIDSREQAHRELAEKIALMTAAHRARERDLQDQMRLAAVEHKRLSLYWQERERALRTDAETREHSHIANLQTFHKDIDSLSEENHSLVNKVTELELSIRAITQDKAALSRYLKQLEAVAAEINRMKATASWRFTAPFRTFAESFGKAGAGISTSKDIRSIHEDKSATATVKLHIEACTASGDHTTSDASQFAVGPQLDPHANHSDHTSESEYFMKNVKHISQLLDMNGAEFINSTYKTLLNRSADSEGMAYYMGRLRAGHAKAKVIVQIAKSKEANAVQAKIPGLEELVETQARGKRWFGGWFSKQSSILAQVHRLEHVLGQLEHRVETRLVAVERNIEAIVVCVKDLQPDLQIRSEAAPACRPESIKMPMRTKIIDGLTLPIEGTPIEIIAALEQQIARSLEAASFNR